MSLRVLLAAALAAAVACAAPVSAADPHWARGSAILTWIDPADMPPGADDLVGRAMRTWTTAAQGRFTLQSTTFERLARLNVHFFRSASKFGETLPGVDPRTGTITEAEVRITVLAEGDALDRRIVLYLTALHEIGHALGLPHRDDFNSIMYFFHEPGDPERYFGRYRALVKSAGDVGLPGASGLSVEDVTTLRSLYDR